MSNGFSVGAERVCLIWTAVVKNLPHKSGAAQTIHPNTLAVAAIREMTEGAARRR